MLKTFEALLYLVTYVVTSSVGYLVIIIALLIVKIEAAISAVLPIFSHS
jgi:hypothetical protein